MSIIQLYLCFTIAHLMGDFLFQTSTLVKMKSQSWTGVLLHVALISLAMNMVLLPYVKELWIPLVLNLVFHFILDNTKIHLDGKRNKPRVLSSFFLDQGIHMIFLLGLVFWIQPENLQVPLSEGWACFYSNTYLLGYLAGLIFFSYCLDIILFIFRLHKKDFTPYKRDYGNMLIRVIVFSSIYWSLFILLKT